MTQYLLSNKTITTFELDQYKVLWSYASFNIILPCSIKPHIDLVLVHVIVHVWLDDVDKVLIFTGYTTNERHWTS